METFVDILIIVGMGLVMICLGIMIDKKQKKEIDAVEKDTQEWQEIFDITVFLLDGETKNIMGTLEVDDLWIIVESNEDTLYIPRESVLYIDAKVVKYDG